MQALQTVLADPGEADDAWEAYLRSCTEYLRRQILVYQNWPQRSFDRFGYRDEKVFKDMNA